jgi:mRNA-degrading endonuclease RelE of RelBE toxin-antitoxin system
MIIRPGSRRRDPGHPAVPDFEHVPPIWELRIGDYRAFYDVDEAARTVSVRAIRRKGPGQTTGEIIDERDDP